MKLVDAGMQRYDLNLHDAWATARASTMVRSGILLWVMDEEGNLGWGDASPMLGPRRPGLRAVEQNMTALIRTVKTDGAEPALEPPTTEDVEGATRHAWVEAVLAVQAKAAKMPLVRRLAQMRGEGPEPAVTVPVNAVITLLSTKATVAAAKEAVRQGYTCLKVKVDGSRSQVDRIAQVRRAVGPDITIRLDANGSWEELDLDPMLEGLARHNIDYIEQPLPPARIASLQRAHKDTPIPLAADESAHNLAHALALIEKDAVDVIVIKPMAMGGLDRALRLMQAALEHKRRVVVTDSLESAVGRTAALHLAALLGRRAEPCGLASGQRLAQDVVEHPPQVVKARMTVPTAPGLGVEPTAGATR